MVHEQEPLDNLLVQPNFQSIFHPTVYDNPGGAITNSSFILLLSVCPATCDTNVFISVSIYLSSPSINLSLSACSRSFCVCFAFSALAVFLCEEVIHFPDKKIFLQALEESNSFSVSQWPVTLPTTYSGRFSG